MGLIYQEQFNPYDAMGLIYHYHFNPYDAMGLIYPSLWCYESWLIKNNLTLMMPWVRFIHQYHDAMSLN